MMNVKLIKGCDVDVWSGRTDREQYFKKGTIFEDVVDFDEEFYELEEVEGPTYYIPKENCVVVD